MQIPDKENGNKQELENIVNMIITISSAVQDLGILSGRMGASIFMFHYSVYSEQKIYNYFAETLLKDIFEDIHNKFSIYFDKGLAGIGWGIEYLLYNKFIFGDSFEILEDFNKQITQINIKRIEDETLESGLEGLLHYILFHLSSNSGHSIPFDSFYLEDLDILTKQIISQKNDKKLYLIACKYMEWREGNSFHYDPTILMNQILSFDTTNKDNDGKKINIGLCKGYAGIGMKLLNTLSKEKS